MNCSRRLTTVLASAFALGLATTARGQPTYMPNVDFPATIPAADTPAADAPVIDAAPIVVGVSGNVLAGSFALAHADAEHAADFLLRARADDPRTPELRELAFTASLLANRPEALALAPDLPSNVAAHLLLAGHAASLGDWAAAEARFRTLPRGRVVSVINIDPAPDAPGRSGQDTAAEQIGVTQLLQPLLVAWAQAGDGRIDAALATLRPAIDSGQFRAVSALHAALIADIAGRATDARRDYRIAEADLTDINLRLAQIMASFQARQGKPDEAARVWRALGRNADEMTIALPALAAAAARTRPVTRATDGIAEAYLTLAAALRSQEPPQFSLMLLRMALDLRPDFSAARLLLAELREAEHYDTAALDALAPIPADDPLIGVVRLHRAALEDRLGHTDIAARALDRIAQDYPTSPLPLAQLGDLDRAHNRFADAVHAYDRAIARLPSPLSPGSEGAERAAWPMFYARGVAEERAGQWPRAQADFEHALRLAPDQPLVLNYLGYSWADRGIKLTQAREMLERAARARPNDGAIVDSLGWVLLRQGESRAAIHALEHATELQPTDSSINDHLGDAYAAVGRGREAVFQWRRALTLGPEPADAARLRRKLASAETTATLAPHPDTKPETRHAIRPQTRTDITPPANETLR